MYKLYTLLLKEVTRLRYNGVLVKHEYSGGKGNPLYPIRVASFVSIVLYRIFMIYAFILFLIYHFYNRIINVLYKVSSIRVCHFFQLIPYCEKVHEPIYTCILNTETFRTIRLVTIDNSLLICVQFLLQLLTCIVSY